MAVAKRVDHFGALYDPIHGTLDIADIVSADTFVGSIAMALRSPIVDRLRRIKQLGFASYQFVGADHSRYAHALGTLHMMQTLLRHIPNDLQSAAVAHLRDRLPAAARVFASAERASVSAVDVLAQYTLAAALFQDAGELPYETATGLIFLPDNETQRRVAEHVGYDVYGWEPKQIFGVASLLECGDGRDLAGFDLQLLAFLIVGRQYPWIGEEPAIRAWLNLLDGEVDADRLDYVYRDAHHTVGVRGDPQSVVESLLHYDEVGPIVADVAPVLDFLATRANLWRSVYLSPQNRFRRVLLVVLLRDIFYKDQCSSCANEFLSRQVAPRLGMAGFKTFDDVWLWERLRQISEDRFKRTLTSRAKIALELLLSERADYEYAWVPAGEGAGALHADSGDLPGELFFDTYSELYRHHFYEPGSIRIDAPNLRYLGVPVALEEAYFGGFMVPDFVPQLVIRAAQVFMPVGRSGAQWDRVAEMLETGAMFNALLKNDIITQLEVPTDTRGESGFKGPTIFVSFRSDDVDSVDEILRELHGRRRHYYALRGSYQGLGATAGENSRTAVRTAEAALVVASVDYCLAYQRDPNGNIHIEIDEMQKRRDNEAARRLSLVVLSLDPWQDIEKMLPWRSLGYPAVPFVGEPLRGQPRKKVVEAVDAALEEIDRQYGGTQGF